jgi:uncharacterized spore protein YtfJ
MLMKHTVLLTVCVAALLGILPAVGGMPRAAPLDSALRESVEELQRVYATEIVLGKPLELDGLKIIPVATVGFGYGQRQGTPEQGALHGVGGVLSPVGVLVVSPTGVQLLAVPKGLVEQLLGGLAPVIAQVLHGESTTADGRERGTRLRLTPPAIVGALYALLPQGSMAFGFFPWPLSRVLLFVLGWLALALLSGVFFPQQVAAVAATLRDHTLRTGLIGVLSAGAVGLLAVVFTLSLIGLPLTILVILLAWAVQLFGMIGLALLVGQTATAAMQRPRDAALEHILIGGILLGLVRMLPFLGWIIWLILGLFGFGAVLLTRLRQGR